MDHPDDGRFRRLAEHLADRQREEDRSRHKIAVAVGMGTWFILSDLGWAACLIGAVLGFLIWVRMPAGYD